MARDPVLLAKTEAYWLAYDAAGTDEERFALWREGHVAHGGRMATRADVVHGEASFVGDLRFGLHPIRLTEL